MLVYLNIEDTIKDEQLIKIRVKPFKVFIAMSVFVLDSINLPLKTTPKAPNNK